MTQATGEYQTSSPRIGFHEWSLATIENGAKDLLNAAMKEARNDGTLPWLRPDTKTQVTVEYKHDGGAVVPLRVDTVVVSAQHAETIGTDELRKEIKEKIIKKVIPAHLLDDRTVYHVCYS